MGLTWKGVGAFFGIKGKPIDAVLKEIGKATGYTGKPEEWGAKLAFDLATGAVSVDKLKASVGAVARFRAAEELVRLRDQIDDALAAMNRT
jgi:hypothetical protein